MLFVPDRLTQSVVGPMDPKGKASKFSEKGSCDAFADSTSDTRVSKAYLFMPRN
jgi:hypothetical protein